MYLTDIEHEAFRRGQAAGLIPADLPLPDNDREINDLIFHIGFLFCAKVAYRNHEQKLRLMELTAFTEEHLNNVIRNLPQIRCDKVAATTNFRLEIYPNQLEKLYHYFSFGKEIVAGNDLAGRMAVDNTPLPAEQILKGFDLLYAPAVRTGLATPGQKAVLAELICQKRLPATTRRKWENMTKDEATQLISSTPKPRPQAELPVSVALVLEVIDRLKPEEKCMLDKLIASQTNERKTA